MGGERERAPRLRDLGDSREPVVGTSDFARVGDVGELPYAVDEVVVPRQRDLRPILVAVVVLVAVVAVAVALAF